MPIKVTCSNCGGVLHAPDDAGGKRGRCPTCGNILPIPAVEGARGSGAGDGLPDVPAGPPGARPPSFADFAMGPQVGPPPGASGDAPRPAQARGSTVASGTGFGSPAAEPPKRAARPAEPKPQRRATEPFPRAGSPAAADDEPTTEGVVKGWKRCRGGLGWVQAATFLLFIPVVLLPGYYTANAVMKALSTVEVKADLIPYKDPGYLGLAGVDSALELPLLVGGVPVLLALLLTLFGRLGFAGGPKRSAVGGPGMLSALGTLIGLLAVVAVAMPNVANKISGGDLLPAGSLLFAWDSTAGLMQRLAIFLGIGAVGVGEFWFASAVGRVGAALADGRTAARSTRYQMLLGLVVIGLVGTAAIAPSENFGLWGGRYNSPNTEKEFPDYTAKRRGEQDDARKHHVDPYPKGNENPAHKLGAETNDLVAGQWEKHVAPQFNLLGAYQPVLAPGLFLLGGLLMWVVYLRLAGAARTAIGAWLDAHAGP